MSDPVDDTIPSAPIFPEVDPKVDLNTEDLQGDERDVGEVDGNGPDSHFYPAAGTYQPGPVRNNRLPKNTGVQPLGLTQGVPSAPGYRQQQSGMN